jgi:hypothetical protein
MQSHCILIDRYNKTVSYDHRGQYNSMICKSADTMLSYITQPAYTIDLYGLLRWANTMPLDIHLSADMRYHRGINYNLSAIDSPNTIPPMSIGLHVRMVHQPKWCVRFIAVHRPLHLARMSAHVVHLFYSIISAHKVPRYGPIRAHRNFCCNRPRLAGSMLSGICTRRGLQCYR